MGTGGEGGRVYIYLSISLSLYLSACCLLSLVTMSTASLIVFRGLPYHTALPPSQRPFVTFLCFVYEVCPYKVHWIEGEMQGTIPSVTGAPFCLISVGYHSELHVAI